MYALAEDGGAFGEVARGGFDGGTVSGGFGGRFGGGVAALSAEVADRGRPLRSASEGMHSGRLLSAPGLTT